ncbi:MAG: hypothetical protein JW716_02070 [Candidatus Aenigmarchaeota archaeon]|nr:hypothetical protein [Candidatus Aenigmarchaeota archaeon]
MVAMKGKTHLIIIALFSILFLLLASSANAAEVTDETNILGTFRNVIENNVDSFQQDTGIRVDVEASDEIFPDINSFKDYGRRKYVERLKNDAMPMYNTFILYAKVGTEDNFEEHIGYFYSYECDILAKQMQKASSGALDDFSGSRMKSLVEDALEVIGHAFDISGEDCLLHICELIDNDQDPRYKGFSCDEFNLNEPRKDYSCFNGKNEIKCLYEKGFGIEEMAEIENLSDKTVYIIDNNDWRDTLSLLPIAVYHGKENPLTNIVKNPWLVYYREFDNVDMESSLIYLRQLLSIDSVKPEKIVVISDSEIPKNLGFALLDKETGLGLNGDMVSFMTPSEYKIIWEGRGYDSIVIASSVDYDMGLLAAHFASFINTPLIFTDDSSESFRKSIEGYETEGKMLYFAGKNGHLSELYKGFEGNKTYFGSIDELQKTLLYLTKANETGRMILVNPADIYYGYCINSTLNTAFGKITEPYCGDSINAPLLAILKNEIIVFANVEPLLSMQDYLYSKRLVKSIQSYIESINESAGASGEDVREYAVMLSEKVAKNNVLDIDMQKAVLEAIENGLKNPCNDTDFCLNELMKFNDIYLVYDLPAKEIMRAAERMSNALQGEHDVSFEARKEWEDSVWNNAKEVKRQLDSFIEQNGMADLVKNQTNGSLTVIAAPNFIPYSIYYVRSPTIEKTEYRMPLDSYYANFGGTTFLTNLKPVYEDFGESGYEDIPVGRITGITVSDSSSYINRLLSFESGGLLYFPRDGNLTALSDISMLNYITGGEPYYTQTIADGLEAQGFSVECSVSYKDINGICRYSEWGGVHQDILDSDIYIDTEHGTSNLLGYSMISSEDIPELHSTIGVTEGCLSNDFYRAYGTELFGANVMRRGGSAHIGPVGLTKTIGYDTLFYRDSNFGNLFLVNILKDEISTGKALMDTKMFEIPITKLHIRFPSDRSLLGDPTVVPALETHLNTENFSFNFEIEIVEEMLFDSYVTFINQDNKKRAVGGVGLTTTNGNTGGNNVMMTLGTIITTVDGKTITIGGMSDWELRRLVVMATIDKRLNMKRSNTTVSELPVWLFDSMVDLVILDNNYKPVPLIGNEPNEAMRKVTELYVPMAEYILKAKITPRLDQALNSMWKGGNVVVDKAISGTGKVAITGAELFEKCFPWVEREVMKKNIDRINTALDSGMEVYIVLMRGSDGQGQDGPIMATYHVVKGEGSKIIVDYVTPVAKDWTNIVIDANKEVIRITFRPVIDNILSPILDVTKDILTELVAATLGLIVNFIPSLPGTILEIFRRFLTSLLPI